ncbi:MAG TPA: MBL fold metallo-hydrolase [Blastocatellia bacterium]|nr:MBL fold metallo-hydrolase [Blastocatellia bacterium]
MEKGNRMKYFKQPAGFVAFAVVLYMALIGANGPRYIGAQTPRSLQEPDAHRLRVVMLGTGTPAPDPERSGPAVAVVAGNSSYLVDCGAGVVRRSVAAAMRYSIRPLFAVNLKVLFVTHLHSDHTVGYPDLILTPAVAGRSGPLEVYGPPGIKAMTDHILEAYKEDISLRVHGMEHEDPAQYVVNVHEIQPGVIYKDANVTVTAFAVHHGEWKHAFGYKFETPDRTAVISGDTSPTQTVVDNCNGCDLLVHEVYCQEGFKALPAPRKEYFTQYHTSGVELGKLASEAHPNQLVLYHQVLWNCPETELLAEIGGLYKGKVTPAHDLDMY